jgi:predicted phosphoribosyltransferase
MIFRDRIDAADKLAQKLEWLKEEDEEEDIQRKSIIILSVPRGGVVIGDVVSRILDANSTLWFHERLERLITLNLQ